MTAGTTLADFRPSKFGAGRGWLTMHAQGSASTGFYSTGEFVHRLGIVRVYRQSGLTVLNLADGSRIQSRRWQRAWGDRTISRLCRQFIEDVFG